MSDTDRKIKKCKICSEAFAIYEHADWGNVITHYEREHPDSDLIDRVVEDQHIETVCEGCDTEFVGQLHWSEDHLTVDAYCEQCVEEDPLNDLIVDSIPGKLAVEQSVDTGTDQTENTDGPDTEER